MKVRPSKHISWQTIRELLTRVVAMVRNIHVSNLTASLMTSLIFSLSLTAMPCLF